MVTPIGLLRVGSRVCGWIRNGPAPGMLKLMVTGLVLCRFDSVMAARRVQVLTWVLHRPSVAMSSWSPVELTVSTMGAGPSAASGAKDVALVATAACPYA